MRTTDPVSANAGPALEDWWRILSVNLTGPFPAASRLVLIDQSYTLRDPHLAPRDAKPGDLVPLPAPDWKPFVDRDAFFRPTVRDFLRAVMEDERWPVEVNIYPYEELARTDPQPGRGRSA